MGQVRDVVVINLSLKMDKLVLLMWTMVLQILFFLKWKINQLHCLRSSPQITYMDPQTTIIYKNNDLALLNIDDNKNSYLPYSTYILGHIIEILLLTLEQMRLDVDCPLW